MTTEPRILHNESLYREFFTKRGLESTCLPVHKQIESVVVNRLALHNFGFNGSIIKHKGRILIAYRHNPNGGPSSELAIAELDEKFNVKNNQNLKV